MTHIQVVLASLSVLSLSVTAQDLPTYRTRLVAGSADNGIPGVATAARVLSPTRITGDSAGNIYFFTNDLKIHMVDSTGLITYFAGNGSGIAGGDGDPALAAGIPNIFGMTVFGEYLYFSQQQPCHVRRIHLNTRVVSNFAGTGACQSGTEGPATQSSLMNPTGLAFDAQGRLYVGESNGIRLVDATGIITRWAGGGPVGFSGDGGTALDAQFDTVRGLARDASGNMYLVDGANRRIRRIDASTSIVSTILHLSLNPGQIATDILNGLAVDSGGSKVYFPRGTSVSEINTSTGTVKEFAGASGRAPNSESGWLENAPVSSAMLRSSQDVWTDANARVFLTDFNRVIKVSSTGIASTLAGGNLLRGEGKPAQSAWLFPSSAVIEPEGSIVIGDLRTHRLIRVSKQGVATTIAGRSSCPEAPVPSVVPACPRSYASGDGGPALEAEVKPGQLTRDNAGNIYFVDLLPVNSQTATGPNAVYRSGVRRITPNGVISEFGPRLYLSVRSAGVGGVAVDPSGRYLYITQTEFSRVIRWDSQSQDPATAAITYAGRGAPFDGRISGFSGDGSSAIAARLQDPANLALDAGGNLYIADFGNNRIRMVDTNGVITTVAGSGKLDYSGDGGPAIEAGVPAPVGVAVDAQGNLFISTAAAVLRVDKVTRRLHRIAGGTSIGVAPLGGSALGARFNATDSILLGDYTPTSTRFTSVGSIALSPNGEVLFPDLLNRRVAALVPDSLATPTVTGVISLSNFGAGEILSSGGWLELYGFKLASSTVQWAGSDFNGNAGPTTLGGVQVLFNGTPGVVQLVSAGQVNAIPKDGIGAGNATIQVINANGPSNLVAMSSALRGPGLLAPPSFSDGTGKRFVAALHTSDGAFVGPPNLIPGAAFRRAKSGDRLLIYGIGFGSVSPNVPAGSIATGSTTLPNVRFKIGARDAVIEYSSLAPGFVGLYQFNIVVPTGITVDAPLEVTVDGVAVAQTLFIGVE